MQGHTRTPHDRARIRPSTKIVGASAAVLSGTAFLFGGLPSVLFAFGLVALLTGLYILLTGRKSWAMVPGKRVGGVISIALSLGFVTTGYALDARQPDALFEALQSGPEQGSGGVPASPAPDSNGSEPSQPSAPNSGADDGRASAAVPGARNVSEAAALLATVEVKGRAPKTGYDRSQFGQTWDDVDRNGCDTRNDILQRDLTQVVFTNSVPCKVQSGTLEDPYTAKTIQFVRGSDTSTAVQIDHVVALSDAWQKGAQQLSLEQRTAFANDPRNLQATDGPTNQKKSDGDAATWLPPNKEFRCDYVARQILVKVAYHLWVTQAEHDAMERVLRDCPAASTRAD